MRLRFSACVALAALIILNACGGSSSTGTPVPGSQNQRPIGPGLPIATPDDFEIVGDEMKSASAVYNKFFLDSVNAHSGGRWTVENSSGSKQFVLSNSSFSAPKAWVLGQNYWNRETDALTTNAFNVADGTDGVRLSFYARWSLQANDFCGVSYFDGTNNWLVTQFTDGANPDYPNWTKYYFELPANLSGQDQACTLRVEFTSDTAGTSWGFGIDSVAVYQRQLVAPTNVAASDGGGATEVTWDAATDPLVPEFYDIYMSDSEFGTYDYVISVQDPQIDTNEFASGPQDGVAFWYKVKARKQGWPDSPFSNADSGFWVL